MDIKFNPGGNRISKPGMGKGGNIQRDPAFNIKDKFIKGEKPLDIPGKPVFKSVTSTPAQEFDSVTASASLQSSSVSAAVPATMGIPLSKLMSLLSDNSVTFYEKRRFRIPKIMDKKKSINSDEAQKILTDGTDSQKKGLKARVDGNLILGFKAEDARDLVALKNLDKSGNVKPDDMMKLLEKASEFGAEIKVKGTETSGVYPAYRHLAGRGVEEKIADAPVIIEREGIELLTIKPGQKGNVKAYEGKLNKWMDIFKRAGDYKSDARKNVIKTYKHLHEKSGDESNFKKIEDLFIKALKAAGRDEWDGYYPDMIDFIADKLHDKPADFDVFTNLLKDNVDIPVAIKMYDKLPLPVKNGDYNEVASTFLESKFHFTDAVETAMEPVGDSSLTDRLDVLKGIYKHSKGEYSSDQWENTKNDYEYLKKLTPGGKDFIKLGKLYCRMLDAYNSEKHKDVYKTGLDFISKELKDKPEDSDVFVKILKKDISITSAIIMYEQLATPIKPGDYEKVASVFHDKSFSSRNIVETAMKPVGDSSLTDRLDVLKGIYKHSKGEYSGDQWENTKNDYEYLKKLTPGGKNFIKLGKLYCRMLDAYNSEKHKDVYKTGLDFISKELKDKPEDSDVFIKILKKDISITSAIIMYKQLATPIKPGDYEKVASVFHDKNFSSKNIVETVMKPVGNSSLTDRLDVLKGIYKHTKGHYNSEQWENTKNNYKYLKTLTPGGKDFIKLGKLYCRMLDAYNSEEYKDIYKEGLNLIAGKLRDKPDDVETFIKILKNDVSISSAILMYDMQTQPVNDGDYERVSTIFLTRKFHSRNQVKLAMTDIEGTTLEERVDILSGIYRHTNYRYDNHKWGHTVEAFDNLKSKSVNGKDLVRIGKMFVEMLDANGSERWSDDYNKGMDFITDKLKDSPDDYRQFINLLKHKVSISSAIMMYEMLTQPVKKGDYKRASNTFLKSDFHYTKYVFKAMKPVGDTSLQEKVDILKGIFRHAKDSNDSQQWDHTTEDYEYIMKRSVDGKAFRDISKMYIEMLDANNSKTYSSYYRDGLDLIISDLRKKPEDFRTFIDLIKSGVSINSTIKMYTMLPKPIEKGEYRRVTSLFVDNKFSSSEKVSIVMEKLWDVSIEDKMEIAKGIYEHSEGRNSDAQLKSTRGNYEYMRKRAKNGDDFVRIGKMYVKLLDTRGSKEKQNGYEDGLQEITTRFKENPEGFESLLRIVEGSKDIRGSIGAYNAIQKPVGNLDYETREKIVTKLVGRDFNEIYDIVILQLKPDENFEEIAELYRTIASNYKGDDYNEVRELVIKILGNRGELGISVIAQLADNFNFYDSDQFMHVIEVLKRPIHDTSDKEKVDIFNEIFKNNYKSDKNKAEDALKDFELLVDGVAPEETLKDAYKRFKLLIGIVGKKKKISSEEIKSAYVMLAKELKKGTFGSKTAEDITGKLGENLIMADNIQDAMDQLIHSMSIKKKKTIEVGDGEVKIGGVKLKIKGDRK